MTSRNARIGLLFYKDGENDIQFCQLVLAWRNGGIIKSQIEYKPVRHAVGKLVAIDLYVELTPTLEKLRDQPAQKVKLMAVEGRYAQLKMPSGEFRMILNILGNGRRSE